MVCSSKETFVNDQIGQAPGKEGDEKSDKDRNHTI